MSDSIAKVGNLQRSQKFLDSDCPAEVACLFFDNRFADCYSVVYRTIYELHGKRFVWGRGMSERPTHPQGYGQSFELPLSEVSRYRISNTKRRIKWSELPETVKQCIRQDAAAVNFEC